MGTNFSGASESTKLLLDLVGLYVRMVCLYCFSLYVFSFICAASLKSSWDLYILCFSIKGTPFNAKLIANCRCPVSASENK